MNTTISQNKVTEVKQLLEEYVDFHPRKTSSIITETLTGQTNSSLDEIDNLLEDELLINTIDISVNNPEIRYHLNLWKNLCDYLSQVPVRHTDIRKYHPEHTPANSAAKNTQIIGNGSFSTYKLTNDEYAVLLLKRNRQEMVNENPELNVTFTTTPDRFFEWTLSDNNWYRLRDIPLE